MVARGLSCVLAGLMIGGISPASAASETPAFNVDSLPQVADLTTFSVKSSSNDKHCFSTSMNSMKSDKYIQVCGESVTSSTTASTTSTPAPSGGGGDESGTPPAEDARNAPQASRRLTASKDDTTTSTLAPQENSYFQLMNTSKFNMIARKVSPAKGTVFKSVTSYDDSTILISTEGSKVLAPYDSTTLEPKSITLEKTASESLTLTMDKPPRSIAWDKAEKKLYATDGETNKIYVFDSTFKAETPIEVSCGKEGKTTTHLGDIVYVKPYLYIAIEGTSYIIRVDIANAKCDNTWLVDFSKYEDPSFKETDKKITSFSMDASITKYTGTGFPKMMIAGNKWNHMYELSNASSYVVSSFVIFAITAITSIFSS